MENFFQESLWLFRLFHDALHTKKSGDLTKNDSIHTGAKMSRPEHESAERQEVATIGAGLSGEDPSGQKDELIGFHICFKTISINLDPPTKKINL